MTVKDTIAKSITKYPTLYFFEDYERAKFEVLHHYFFVIGSGTEWALTENEKNGGYLTEPKYKQTDDDEYIRVIDADYGVEKWELDKKFLKEKAYTLYELSAELSELFGRAFFDPKSKSQTVFESDIPNLSVSYVFKDDTNWKEKKATHLLWPIERRDKDISPYPNFSKNYSPFWGPECKYIQEDWRLAAIEHIEILKKYFQDDNRCKNYYHRYTAKTVEEIIGRAKNDKKNNGNWVEYIRKEWEWPQFDENKSNEENAEIHWRENGLPEIMRFLDETLNKLYSIHR